MASCEGRRHRHNLVPLAALISRDLKSEKIEKPTVRYGHAAQSRKGEDYFLFKTDCQRVPGNSSSTFSVFAVIHALSFFFKFESIFFSVGIVEELFEEGSAMLAERLGNDEPRGRSTSGLFVCAVCQLDLAPSEGISFHAGAIFSTSSKPWQGPFLCADCRNKKDAMEGKRPSGVKVA